MKAKLITLVAAIFLILGSVYYSQHMMPNAVPNKTTQTDKKRTPFPNVTFTTPDGKTFSIADIKEPTVLVHFWAAWCLPCHAELPQLIKYIGDAHGKIALISISLDDNYADSQKLLDKVGIDAPHVYKAWDKDKKLSAQNFGTVKVPETIVLNAQRMMEDKIIGPGPWAEAAKP